MRIEKRRELSRYLLGSERTYLFLVNIYLSQPNKKIDQVTPTATIGRVVAIVLAMSSGFSAEGSL